MRALVTGAGGRLGRAMAVALAEEGHDVAVHYASSAEGAHETVRTIEAAGRKAVALRAELTSAEEAQSLLPAAADALGGPVTVLVNSASVFEPDGFGTITPDRWRRHHAVNLEAPVLLTQAMAAQGLVPEEGDEPTATGLIVNMLDEKVLHPAPDFLSYTLAKCGLHALTLTAAQALGPAIRVNAIAPGATVIGVRQSEDHFAAMRADSPLKRGGDAGDICEALRYLLHARAVTGQVICVDGGRHLA